MKIDQMKQNHPELIVNQLKEISPTICGNTVRDILKNTGVSKWLKNRRYIIQLKEIWKKEIYKLQVYAQHYKDNNDMKMYHRTNERMKALSDCRQQLRTICHSNRETSFPTGTISFHDTGNLPDNFPTRPSTQYLKRRGL